MKMINIDEDDEFGKLYEETNIMLESLRTSMEEKIEANRKIDYLKRYDVLTGLPKKEFFLTNLSTKIDLKSGGKWHILFIVDIGKFKMLNDAYGHHIGDDILSILAKKLKETFLDADDIAKIGIDAFLLSFRDVSDTQEGALKKAEEILQRIKSDILQTPLKIAQQEIRLQVHIGINVYTDGTLDAGDILTQTDNALQTSKRNEKLYAFYNRKMEEQVQKSLALYADIDKALQKKQFVLYYQLQNSVNGEVVGAEALIRWKHPEKGMVSPAEFIPVAENSGQIITLGNWILEEACCQLALWKNHIQTSHWTLSVNVSARQFNDEQFISFLFSMIDRYQVDPQKLKIELTESLLVNNFDKVIEKMYMLKEKGIQISIDDFGTGYSSLQYLKELPLDQLKIDQSFVFGMLHNKTDEAIVRMIIDIADAFGFEVIAEGVETKEHFEVLKAFGCKIFQGFYFAKPQPMECITADLYDQNNSNADTSEK